MTDWIAYTCIEGGYDRLVNGGAVASLKADSRAQFLCFADAQLKTVPAPWQKREFASPLELVSGHDINRYHKLFPHRVLPQCDFSIYHDGNIRFDADYSLLVDRLRRSGAALGAFSHPAGRSLEDEVQACEEQGKLDVAGAAIAAQQLSRYRAEGFDCTQMISANYLLVRDHRHPAFGPAMALWWEQLTTFTGRDQFSLGYVLWQTGLPFVFLDDSSSTTSGASQVVPVRLPHHGERLRKRWQRLRSLVTGRSAKIASPERGSNPSNDRIKQ